MFPLKVPLLEAGAAGAPQALNKREKTMIEEKNARLDLCILFLLS
jgi:hypothetical protein